MLYEFVAHNREALNTRCRAMLGLRPDPPAYDAELRNGVPMLLGQLAHALHAVQHGVAAAAYVNECGFHRRQNVLNTT